MLHLGVPESGLWERSRDAGVAGLCESSKTRFMLWIERPCDPNEPTTFIIVATTANARASLVFGSLDLGVCGTSGFRVYWFRV